MQQEMEKTWEGVAEDLVVVAAAVAAAVDGTFVVVLVDIAGAVVV